jgi:hypothetical protein
VPTAAQALATQQAGALGLPTTVPTPDDTGAITFVKLIVGAAKAGDWKLVTVLGLIGLIWATRRFGSKFKGKVGAFIASDAGGVVVAFLWSFFGLLGAALTVKMPLTLHLIGEALLLSFTAMGGWAAVKKLVALLPAPWQAKLDWLFGELGLEDSPAPATPNPADSQKGSSSSATAVALALLAMFGLGCQHWIDCNKTTVLPDVEAAVVKILGNPGASWQTDLATVLIAAGPDEFACTVQSVMTKLEGLPAVAGTPDLASGIQAPDRNVQLMRGYFFLASHGLRCAK